MWASTAGITDSLEHSVSVVYNVYMYVLGGCNSTYTSCTTAANNLTTVLKSNISTADPRITHYSKLIDFGSTVNVISVTYSGLLPTGNAAITYRAAGSNGVFGSSATASSVAGSIGCVGTTTNIRYLFISVTLDDSTGQSGGGSFPDTAGTNANLALLTTNYNPTHPTPAIRLRAGQTLQQGNLSPLDTCFP